MLDAGTPEAKKDVWSAYWHSRIQKTLPASRYLVAILMHVSWEQNKEDIPSGADGQSTAQSMLESPVWGCHVHSLEDELFLLFLYL